MFKFIKKKTKNKDIYTRSYIVKDTDNIISIAQEHGIPWKDLADANDIKSPYILIAGESIRVPGKQEDEQINEVDKDLENMSFSSVQNNKAKNIRTNQVEDFNSKKQDLSMQSQKDTHIKSEQGSKKRITYASPDNMLTQPTSEPTTRAIDIEWMKDDEEIYAEEMLSQQKKINLKFLILIIINIILIGIGVWGGSVWFLDNRNNDSVSVDNLIKQEIAQQEQEDVEQDNDNENSFQEEIQQNENNSATSSNGTSTKNDEDVLEEKQDDQSEDINTEQNTASVEDIKIQILNAGAVTGSAGTVTDLFKNEGYDVQSAKNAQNDYVGVVIYYNTESKEDIETVAALVSEKYGTQKHEESDSVTNKYSADFVVVLGS